MWKYVLLCWFALCSTYCSPSQLCSCQTMFCILRVFLHFHVLLHTLYLLMLIHFQAQFISHETSFELCAHLICLEMHFPALRPKCFACLCSCSPFSVGTLWFHPVLCGCQLCWSAFSKLQYFAEWRHTNQTVNGSLWSANPFSFSYYAHICVALKWVESFLSCVVIVECGSQLESIGNGGEHLHLHKVLGWICNFVDKKKRLYSFYKGTEAKWSCIEILMEMSDGRNKVDWFVCPCTEGGSKLNWQVYLHKMKENMLLWPFF